MMRPSLSLVFGVHGHLPVGAGEAEADRAADEVVLPILNVLAEHPKFKFSAHLSGAFLRQIEPRRPALIDLLKNLSSRGQLEMLGGGMYEPILTALSETDRVGQIRRFSEYLQRMVGQRPRGLWPAEQVWDPQLCRAMQESQLQYVFLEDEHLVSAGVPPEEISGLFLTEDSGHRALIFPICSHLKNMIPLNSPDDVTAWLKSKMETQGVALLLSCIVDASVFDPGSEKRSAAASSRRLATQWLDRFIQAAERLDFVRPVTPSEIVSTHMPHKLVYVPAGGIFLRGGAWKSFFTKYSESNWMQKRVFAASAKMGPVLEKLGADRESRTVRDLLDRASCNDAYWHGESPAASGGLYRPLLRRAVYENLLEAETRFSKKMGLFPTCYSDDIDFDGHPELLVYTRSWVLGVRPHQGGAFVEWSFRPARCNFQNTLTRRPESYHANLRQKWRILTADKTVWSESPEHLREFLVYDRYPKSSGLLYALDPSVSLKDFKHQTLPERAPAIGAYESKVDDKAETFEIHLRRRISASGAPSAGVSDAGRLEEINFEKHIVISKQDSILWLKSSLEYPAAARETLLGVGLELFYGSLQDVTLRFGEQPPPAGEFGPEGEVRSRQMEIADVWSGTRLFVTADQEVRFLVLPSYTVSKSKTGIERTFQGLSVLAVTPAAGLRQELNLKVEVQSLAGTQA